MSLAEDGGRGGGRKEGTTVAGRLLKGAVPAPRLRALRERMAFQNARGPPYEGPRSAFRGSGQFFATFPTVFLGLITKRPS